MTTNNLSLPEIVESQANKNITHNEALAILDRAVAGTHTHDVASDADITLVDDQLDSMVLVVTDTGVLLTTGRNVIVADKSRVFVAVNSTAQTLTYKTAAGTGIAVATGKTAILRSDGINVYRVTADV